MSAFWKWFLVLIILGGLVYGGFYFKDSLFGDDDEEEDGNDEESGKIKVYGPGEEMHYHDVDPLKFLNIDEISRDPSEVPEPTGRSSPEVIKVHLVAREVVSEIAPGVEYNYWTFDGRVPGPMIRTRVGDTVELSLENALDNTHDHSIDLHAVTGPGGGAVSTQVPPGENRAIRFKTLNPGVYVYHCATPNVAAHMANGMYGLIIVEPEEGFPPVDKEFYVMQGELYTEGELGEIGFQQFDPMKMINEDAEYVVFNGRVDALVDNVLEASVGERVRLYIGNGGVSYVSSFHVIGEIFDRVYHEASTTVHENVQTTVIPAGGATVVEFDVDYPGDYLLVDHAITRTDRGAWGILRVDGEEDPEIFKKLKGGEY
jgi:nitrite reductase (NO-forming)